MRAVAIPISREGSRIKVLNPTLMRRVVESLRPNKPYHLIIEPKDKGPTVSDPLRRYYFAVVAAMIAEETGHSKEAIHDFLKRKILGVDVDKYGIETVSSVFSSESGMTVQEKKAYVDEVRRWAFDFLNIAIPPPETVVF